MHRLLVSKIHIFSLTLALLLPHTQSSAQQIAEPLDPLLIELSPDKPDFWFPEGSEENRLPPHTTLDITTKIAKTGTVGNTSYQLSGEPEFKPAVDIDNGQIWMADDPEHTADTLTQRYLLTNAAPDHVQASLSVSCLWTPVPGGPGPGSGPRPGDLPGTAYAQFYLEETVVDWDFDREIAIYNLVDHADADSRIPFTVEFNDSAGRPLSSDHIHDIQFTFVGDDEILLQNGGGSGLIITVTDTLQATGNSMSAYAEPEDTEEGGYGEPRIDFNDGSENGKDAEQDLFCTPAAMKVDYNRNGAADIIGDDGDNIPEGERYRFWTNIDNDVGDDAAANDRRINYDSLPDPNSDAADNTINSLRDLEDFTRLHLDLRGLTRLIDDGTEVKIGLKFSDSEDADQTPQIRAFLSEDQETGSDRYLFNLDAANNQVHGPERYSNGLITVGADTSWFPAWGLDYLSESSRLHLIFEGVTPGKASLSMIVQIGGGPETTIPFIPMEIMHVRDMYEHWTAGDYEGNDINPLSISSVAKRTPDSGIFSSEGPEADDAIVFVHGWRMRTWERRQFADTSFKRLWQSGFAGKFYHFSWPTEYTDRVEYLPGDPPADLSNYANSERLAYISGANAFKDFLDNHIAAAPEEVRVFAHSMGGIVVSEALLRGAVVDCFAACQIAMPAHAYGRPTGAHSVDRNAIVQWGSFEIVGWQTPEVYADFPPTSDPYYKSITGVMYNYYNPDDSALGLGWRLGQNLKPNDGVGLAPDEGYDYDDVADVFTHELRTLDFTVPNDVYEIYAHGAQARSYPLGAIYHDDIPSNFDLSAGFPHIPGGNFTSSAEDHSAQFRGTYMTRYFFWMHMINAAFNSSTTRPD